MSTPPDNAPVAAPPPLPHAPRPALLSVTGLRIAFPDGSGGWLEPVRGVDFSVNPGECVVLAGESGCGKSLSALAVCRLAPTDQARVHGTLRINGAAIDASDTPALAALRGKTIAYVFQDPAASLNPVMRIDRQIAECLRHLPPSARPPEIHRLLSRVGLGDGRAVAKRFPGALSGGMQQRVMLAMALANRPRLLIADEPTTALDVLMQKEVLDLIGEVARETGMGVLLITHHLALAAGRADRINILYAGRVVESGPVRDVLRHPLHPYTRGLADAVPRLDIPPGTRLKEIPGVVPGVRDHGTCCPFLPRCPRAAACCGTLPPLRVNGARSVRCCNPL